jgi:hypothetical protein
MVTAFPGAKVEADAHALGLTGPLRKPLNPSRFIDVVRDELGVAAAG